MKILIIDNDYPNEQNLYGDVFVHLRIKEYQSSHECLVLSLTAGKDFVYEGVVVKACRSVDHANGLIQYYIPDIILIHFVLRNIIHEIIPRHNVPYLVWVHGYEALGWYRRLFNYTWGFYFSLKFLSLVKTNMQQLISLRRLIKSSNRTKDIGFIFVSNWMKRLCEADTFINTKRSWVIANPVDTVFFKYTVKDVEKRRNILLIRPFSSKKYATDIAVDAILLLAKEEYFKELSFTIIGKGKYFNAHTDPLKEFSNVTLINTFITQQEIRNYHSTNGIFLCPTRQDAQGVSMCEAMSSGLVPISSFNTAIPEFVNDNISGFLTRNSNEIANKISYLYKNPREFLKMSAAAADAIVKKCAINNIIQRELEVINEHSKVNR